MGEKTNKSSGRNLQKNEKVAQVLSYHWFQMGKETDASCGKNNQNYGNKSSLIGRLNHGFSNTVYRLKEGRRKEGGEKSAPVGARAQGPNPARDLLPVYPLRPYVAKLAQHFEKLAQQTLWEWVSPAEHDLTKVWSHAKMCVVEVPFKLYCTVNVCCKFTASIKEKYPLKVNKTIS